jgi:tRNA1Val (adenine37-N6)-methyltransferase
MRTYRSEDIPLRDGETLDSLFQGRLKVIQPERGYRFSMDSVILAGLTRVRPRDRIVDLGTGCGVIPLLLASQHSVDHIVGIEVQDSLASMAQRNVIINRLSNRIRIVHGDLRTAHEIVTDQTASLVVSNPPYRELRSGRLNPCTEKVVARHEVLAELRDVVRAAARLLSPRGRLALIYPARRLPSLFKELGAAGFVARHLRLIHTTLDAPAKLVHLESVRSRGEELHVHRPLAVYEQNGTYSPELAAMYGGAPVVS